MPDPLLLARARAHTCDEPETQACWELILRGTEVGWLGLEELQELTHCLRRGEDFELEELLFDLIGGRLRVSFLDERLWCSPEALIQELQKLTGNHHTSRERMRRLVPVGFFRELRHGRPDGPVLRDAVSSSTAPDEDRAVRYLRAGKVLIAAPGVVRDVLTVDGAIIGSLSILTDGTYAWPSDLAYYVERHHVRLPRELVSHMIERHWEVPDEIDLAALELG